jgi:aryl-alcohol dehydrogenase-like predicted oxidoreductase
VRHVGLSDVGIAQIQRAGRFFPVASVQNRCNLVDRMWEDVLDYWDRENIGFIPWYPLQAGKVGDQGGAVATKRSGASGPRERGAWRGEGVPATELEAIASRHGATPLQIALAWLLQRSPVMLPIPGTARVKHLEENIAAAGIRLSPEEFESL